MSRFGWRFRIVALAIALTLSLLTYRRLAAISTTVDSPVTLGTYTRECEAATLRGWFANLDAAGTLGFMVRTEPVDTVYAASFGLMFIMLVRLVAAIGKPAVPRFARLLFRFAPLFAIPNALDIVENVSPTMPTDPGGFAEFLAPLPGALARVKSATAIASTSASLGGVVTLTLVVLRVGRARRKSADEGANPAILPS